MVSTFQPQPTHLLVLPGRRLQRNKQPRLTPAFHFRKIAWRKMGVRASNFASKGVVKELGPMVAELSQVLVDSNHRLCYQCICQFGANSLALKK
jgi:hypothetical protein